MLEFALVLPFLLLLVVGALEFGRVYFTKIVLTNSAREGAYFLSFNKDDSTNCTGSGASKICFIDTRQAVMNEANHSGVTLTNADIVITTPCCTAGSPVIVNVGTNVNNIFLLSLLSNGFSLKAKNSSMHISVTVKMVAQ